MDHVSKADRSKIMAAVRGKGNKSTERLFKMALVRSRIRGWKQNPTDVLGRPDIVFQDRRLAIFLDGCFWHFCKSCYRRPKSSQPFWDTKVRLNVARDLKVNRTLTKSGWRVLRIWEHDIRNGTLHLKKILRP